MKKSNPYLLTVVAALVLLLFFYLLIFYGALDPASRTTQAVADFLLMAGALTAVISISLHLTTLDKGEPLRRFWGLIDIAAVSWFISEAVVFFYEALGRELPVTSLADFFWVVSFVPVLMASAGVLVGYKRMGLQFDWRRSVWVIPPIAGILFTVAFWVIRPILTSQVASTADKFFNPAYAILDLLILLPALVVAITLGRSYAGRPILLISFALIAFGVAAIVYLWGSWNGSYYTGSIIDLFWIAGYLLLALAAAPRPKPSLGMEPSSSRASTPEPVRD